MSYFNRFIVICKSIAFQASDSFEAIFLGDNQPGCLAGSCSHSRAHALFAETIISNRFVSTQCTTLQQALNQACTGARGATMGGEPGHVGRTGIFHLRTNGNSPFAMG